jgi:hypothetical protein
MKTYGLFSRTWLVALVVFIATSVAAPRAFADAKPCPQCGHTSDFEGELCDHCAPASDPEPQPKTCEKCGAEGDFPGKLCDHCKPPRPCEEEGQPHRDRPYNTQDGPRPRPDGPRGDWTLSEEDKAELTTFLETNFPETLEHLQEVRTEDPDRAKRGEVMLFALYKMTQDYPEDLQIVAFGNILRRHEIGKLAKEYRETDDEETKEQIKAELKEKIEASFDADIQLKKYQLEQAEAKVEEMRERLEAHESEKEAEVAKTLERVLSGERPDRPRPMHNHECAGPDCETCKHLRMLREAHRPMENPNGEQTPPRDHDAEGAPASDEGHESHDEASPEEQD